MMRLAQHRTLVPVCAMIGALLLTGSCFDDARSRTTAYPTDAPETWDALFDAHDAAALAAEYSVDVISMPFNARTVTGRAAVQAEFERFFTLNPGATHRTDVEELLEGDGWVIERAAYTLTFTPAGRTELVVETGRHVLCRKIEDGKWRIAWELWNTDQPAPGSGATTADAGSAPPLTD